MSSENVVTVSKDNTHSVPRNKYKWYIMVLSALTNALAVATPSMALSVMMPEIAKELNLSLFQSGLIWGAGSLPMIISSLLGGSLCNKYGPRKMLILNSILIGLAGALRGFSGNFVFLLFAVLLLGFFGPMITLSNFMNAVIWFEPRERGLANGIATLGMALGFFIGSLLSATLLSPLLHGWRNVFFLYGGVSILVGLWWMSTRTSPNEALLQHSDSGAISFQQGMSHILKMVSLWFLGIGVLGNSGALQGVLGYLPLYLQGLGWSVASTGGLLATFHIFSMTFVLPISFLADKLNARKMLLVVTAAVAAVGLGLLSILQGSAIWVPIIMAGMVRDAFMAIFFTTVSEVKGVGSAYTGLAAGLMMIFMGVGNLLAPPVGNSLATGGTARSPLMFWAILAGVGAISFALSFWLERRTKE